MLIFDWFRRIVSPTGSDRLDRILASITEDEYELIQKRAKENIIHKMWRLKKKARKKKWLRRNLGGTRKRPFRAFVRLFSSRNKILKQTKVRSHRVKDPPTLLDPIAFRLEWSPGLYQKYTGNIEFFKALRFTLRQVTPEVIFCGFLVYMLVFIFCYLPYYLQEVIFFFMDSFPLYFLNLVLIIGEISSVSYFLLTKMYLYLKSKMIVQLVPEIILLCGILTVLLLKASLIQQFNEVFFKRILVLAFSKSRINELETRSTEARLTGDWLASLKEMYILNIAWNIFFVSILMSLVWMLFNSADYVSNFEINNSSLKGINDVFFGNHFLYDSYTYYSRFFILAITLGFLIIFKSELELDPNLRRVEYVALIMCGVLFAIAMPSASSLLSLFLIAEGLVMVMYILASSSSRSPSGEGSIKYAILNSAATVMFIVGTILIFCCVNDIYFVNFKDDKILIGLFLIALTFVFKLGGFPFQNWMADLYESSLLGILGFFLLIPKLSIMLTLINLNRLFFVKFPMFFGVLFLLLGLLSLIGGATLASAQTKLNRLLAYSSISQAGSLFILLSLSILNPAIPFSLLVLFAIVYSLVSLQTMSFISNLRNGSFNSPIFLRIKNLNLIKYLPVPAQSLFSGFSFNLAGLPPFIGWILKALVIFTALSLLISSDLNLFLLFSDTSSLITWFCISIFLISLVPLYYSIRLYKATSEIQPSEVFFLMLSKDTGILSVANLFLISFVNFFGFILIGYTFVWINFVLF